VILSGCDASLPVGPEETSRLESTLLDSSGPRSRTASSGAVATVSTPGLLIENASLSISGSEHETTIQRLSGDSFTFFFIWVKDKGLFLVSIDGPHFAEVAGEFSGKMLRFSCAGTDVVVENESLPLLSDNMERPALVSFFSNYRLFSADVRPSDLVLGLADELRQIPGFENRNLPPEGCSVTS